MEAEDERIIEYRKQQKEELEYLMSTPIGRRFMFKLMYSRCGLDRDTFSPDRYWSSYAQGRASIAMELKRDLIDNNVQSFLKMEEENNG